jgi:hypothetical protein
MKRMALWVMIVGTLPAAGACLPDNYFANLLGATGAELASFALSEAVNFVFPPS